MARPLTDNDRWLFNAGVHEDLHEILGSHPDGDGTVFRVWAPNAESVAVFGDFNGWDPSSHPMHPSESGVWETRVTGAGRGHAYKYHVTPRSGGRPLEKADPFAVHAETPPLTASKIWHLDYDWGDADWMGGRASVNALDAPISIYEAHLGSWSRQQPMNYREIAHGLADHVERGGFTHVELLPIMEHPFDGSWGYQTTGYFAPTSRFGTPQDFMYLVDHLHQKGIGVILDWVPSHFAVDGHGLAYFDGTHLFEHADPRQGFHPDWGSYIFNYERNEVRSFLTSSAHFWFDRYHIDGIRVDAVASMLYLDYSRRSGEWVPNRFGGRENLSAVDFLRQLNAGIYRRFPDVQTFAEESTAWPMVTRPVDMGGLGFGFKWDMGWMNDTLRYVALDPIFRSYGDNHRFLTFRGLYAFTENYVLPLSHDEVVHGKRSLLDKHPGDEWRRFAGLRALLGYQWAQPGKKLLFMGSEFGDPWEWNHQGELPFFLLEYPPHQGTFRWVGDLNRLYRQVPSMHAHDIRPEGFQWVEADDVSRSTIAFLRWAGGSPVLVIVNFTPMAWEGYRVGVPVGGGWKTLLCSDAVEYGGAGMVPGDLQAEPTGNQGFDQSLVLSVPPLSATFLAPG
ncbi:MAG: 1,4-alpha-glucan branching protein GlgB [Acidimicrobiia bacterium]|jgi:1,4-alpha-glucan branching enzyme